MPRYVQVDDLVARFGDEEIIQLTDRTNNDQIDETVAADALDEAEAEAEGYLRGRYTLPLQTAPRQVKDVILHLARERLDPNPSDIVMQRAREARDVLKAISAGRVQLDIDGETVTAPSLPASRPATSRFDDAALAGFHGYPHG